MSVASLSSRQTAARHLSPLRYTSAAATHPGCVRPINEDACLDLPHVGLWAVADGMGGHDAGALASKWVIDSLSNVHSFDSAFVFRRAVRTALTEANANLQAEATRSMLDTIGATVVTLIAHGSHYACLWAGDSRAYVCRSRRLHRITRDHTLVAELVDTGRMTSSEAEARKYAHVVTRAVGARPSLDIDCTYGAIQPGDRFLLCSDGLGVLDDATIAETLMLPDARQSAESLIRQAIAARAPDNVTAVVIETASQ